MALSVRPGSSRAISAHLFWNLACASMRIWSSSADHASFLTLGSSWLCHRSRICLPLRPAISAASAAHAIGFPGTVNLATSFVTSSSSSLVHGHLMPALLRRSCSAATLAMNSCAARSSVSLLRSWASLSMSSMLLSLRDSTSSEMMRSCNPLNPSWCVSCVTAMRSCSSMLVDPLYTHSKIAENAATGFPCKSTSILLGAAPTGASAKGLLSTVRLSRKY
mmetsp:Transcript_34300/g.80909  ORF Transcript_34300/g.80909 Transcript_34300/m.80909 type:complete len:221 (-) Transcript_34300:645-1307(-)